MCQMSTTGQARHRFRLPCADASIWLVQFIKAKRNQEGDLVRNAHLRGFFSRICKCGIAVGTFTIWHFRTNTHGAVAICNDVCHHCQTHMRFCPEFSAAGCNAGCCSTACARCSCSTVARPP